MLKLSVVVAALCALATNAMAADKPEVGPPPAWLVPPPGTLAPVAGSSGAAIAVLLQDRQVRFEADGESIYQGLRVKIQTAQGLAAMGTVSIAWSPDIDKPVVHAINIIRDGQVISRLPKDGAFYIARREDKLDSEGQLNGVLTALIQVEGLQVGDIVEFAYTVHRSDPLLKGRIDDVNGVNDGIPISFARVRASWPEAASVRWRTAHGMPDPKVETVAGFRSVEVAAENVTPQVKPKGAPTRFQRGRELSLSNYSSWSDVAASMAPLYIQAEQLGSNSPVKAEAAAIAGRTSDPLERAGAALVLVEDKIRYLAQTLGDGGLKPARPDQTWEHRYGDCKAKTVLLIALLKELGIQAEPVLVSTVVGDDLDTRLPSLSVFNHVMVRATIGGRDYWLDGTRVGDTGLPDLDIPNFGFVLPVREQGSALLHLQPPPLKRPAASTSIHLDASAGMAAPAPVHVEVVMRGDAATVFHISMANLSPDDLDRGLRSYWREQYDFITPKTVSEHFDPKTREDTLTLDGTAKLDWSSGYETDGTSLGWKPDLARDPGPNVDAPFTVDYPSYVENREVIVLPNHGKGFSISGGEPVNKELSGYAFHRKAVIEDGVFKVESSRRGLVPEISLTEAKAAVGPLTALSKVAVRVNASASAQSSPEEVDTLMTVEPKTANEYLHRGNILLNAHRYKDAIADFSKAVDLNPSESIALSDRGLAHAWLGEEGPAEEDLARAEKINPRNPVIFRARGLLAERAGRRSAAIAAYTRALDVTPDTFGYYRRGQLYVAEKDYESALADFDAELALDPAFLAVHVYKADIYVLMKAPDKARAELALLKSDPKDADTLTSRVSILVRLDDRKAARAEVDAALEAHATAQIYLLRVYVRDPTDLAGRESDARAAYDLDVKNEQALNYLIYYRNQAKDYPGALVWVNKGLDAKPHDPGLLLSRAETTVKAHGDLRAAKADFAEVRQLSLTQAVALNSLCFQQATVAFELDQALADCDASLALNGKDFHTLDSRAFVLLRLGRDKEALAAYNATLAISPNLADSLYGRSVVERRLDQAEAAEKDKAAAVTANANIVKTFEDYGITN